MKKIEIFERAPEGFRPTVEVSGCYVEREGKVLFLQYATTHPTEAGSWGVPGGKIEPEESPEWAAMRELLEETSLVADVLVYLAPLFFRLSGSVEYVFHLFHVKAVRGVVSIGKEHQRWKWVAPEEIEGLALVSGAAEAYRKFRELRLI